MSRLLFLCAALVFVSTAAFGQAPSTIRLSPQAAHSLDSLASASRAQRVETIACITQYTTDPLTLVTIGPANYLRSDSLAVYTKGGVSPCAPGEPGVHTHVAKNAIPLPSGVDLFSKQRDGLPFALLIVVTDSSYRLVLY